MPSQPRSTQPHAPVDIDEDSLAARAAWLHYSGGLTQSEVAKRLQIPSTKSHRLIARAMRDGLLTIHVDVSVSECVALEEGLSHMWGLEYCRVAPDLKEAGEPMRALGRVGGRFLANALDARTDGAIGIGYGRTLCSVVDNLPPLRATQCSVVSLLGGLTRKFAANPFDVIHRLAEKTGLEAYMLPMPLYANTAADRDVLLNQVAVREAMAKAREADLLMAGIGGVDEASLVIGGGMISEAEADELQRGGAVGEILGHYFDADGQTVTTGLSGRVTSPAVDDLRHANLVAVAGGMRKLSAIRAILASGLLSGLIIDETTARSLLAAGPGV